MKKILSLLGLLAVLAVSAPQTSTAQAAAAAKPEPTIEQRLAGIEAYIANTDPTAPLKDKDGKIPVNDTLLSATVPGVIDAWYIMLSRWGTKNFTELLQPAIDLAEQAKAETERKPMLFAAAAYLRAMDAAISLHAAGFLSTCDRLQGGGG